MLIVTQEIPRSLLNLYLPQLLGRRIIPKHGSLYNDRGAGKGCWSHQVHQGDGVQNVCKWLSLCLTRVAGRLETAGM